MRINNNLMAMNTHRQMGITANSQTKSMEKLSSGYRINRAGDDAAGLAISEKMRAQIRGLNQASRNSQDGISMIQTAEGALNETQNILQRMRELAVQSANDTNVDADRTAIQNEIDQLTSEIDRIGDTTEFNTKKLLNGNAGFSATVEAATGLTISSGGNAVSGTYTMAAVNAGDVAQLALTDTDAATSLNDSNISAGDFTINGTTITVGAGTMASFITAVNNASATTGVTARAAVAADMPGAGAGIILENTGVGSTSQITITAGTVLETGAGGVFVDDINGSATDAIIATSFTGSGTDASANAVAGTSFVGSGNKLTGIGGSLDGIEFNVNPTISGGGGDIVVASNNSVTFQIGANNGQDMDVSFNDMRAAALSVNSIDVSTAALAKTSITTINDAITEVSSERSKLGAYQNRLEHTIANLDTSAENLQASESRIRDVDMAKEMMEFTKNNILQQAAQSMLAQANQQPQGVLQLLRG